MDFSLSRNGLLKSDLTEITNLLFQINFETLTLIYIYARHVIYINDNLQNKQHSNISAFKFYQSMDIQGCKICENV